MNGWLPGKAARISTAEIAEDAERRRWRDVSAYLRDL
jgi:hypothetical protein